MSKTVAIALALVVLVGSGTAAVAQEKAPPLPPSAPATPPAPAAVPASAPAAPVVKGAVLFCDGKVKNDGTVSLLFTPAGGAASEIRVSLLKGMGKEEVCRDLAKEIDVALDDTYKVNGEGGKVKIAGTKKDATFGLALGGQTATGVTVEIKLQ